MFLGLPPEQPAMNFEAEGPKIDFKRRPFHEVLSLSLSKDASDAQGLVYGILALVKNEERITINVDYNNMTPMDVFQLAFELIWTSDHPRSLEVLDRFVFGPPHYGYPSQVIHRMLNSSEENFCNEIMWSVLDIFWKNGVS
jgi:hypothetical protein